MPLQDETVKKQLLLFGKASTEPAGYPEVIYSQFSQEIFQLILWILKSSKLHKSKTEIHPQ